MIRSMICLALVLLVYTTVYADIEKDSTSPGKLVQTGIASWYGRNFHGKTTSNGEVFDMYAMTAAHNTLPHGLYVKVVNSRNGRETVVRINDRGPVTSGRIIDLSYSAAKDLGMIESGLSPVTIEALGYQVKNTKSKIVYREPSHNERGLFGIQVGAYSKRENAETMAETVRERYDSVTIQETKVNGETIFRVRVGKYASLHSAKQQLRQIRDKEAVGGFVVALKRDENEAEPDHKQAGTARDTETTVKSEGPSR